MLRSKYPAYNNARIIAWQTVRLHVHAINSLDYVVLFLGSAKKISYYISDEDKEYILHLKNNGKEVEAVKKVREITAMGLVEAKQYVDLL